MAYRLPALTAAALTVCVAALAGGAAPPARAAGPGDVELVMVEQPGCAWCRRWNEEIAPIWPKTEAGAFAPLRRERLGALPEDLELARRVSLTPTFLVVGEAGRELGRLEGYPGEDFFWPMIERVLGEAAGFASGPRPETTD